MNTQSLKAGWKMVKFGDFVENVREQGQPTEKDSRYYIGLEHLDSGSLHVKRWGSNADLKGRKLKMKKGDLLFAKRNAYLRRVAIAPHDGFFSAHGMVLRPRREDILPEFLPFFLQSNRFMERAIEISVGSLSPTINWKTLRVQEFPLPPLDEQQRFSEILWAADEAMEKLIVIEKETEAARRVALFEFIANGVGKKFRGLTSHSTTGPWKLERISKAGEVQLGRQRAPKYQSGKWTRPYLRVANVFDGYFDFEDVLTMDFDERDFKRYLLRPGDILLNEGQSRELVGRCAMYEGQVNDCCFQNTLVRFRCTEALLPKFAFAYFQYLFYRQTFAAVARQTTSIAHLGADTFQKLYIPVPPIEEQKHIACVMEKFNTSKRDLASHREKVERTRQALIDDLTGTAHV